MQMALVAYICYFILFTNLLLTVFSVGNSGKILNLVSSVLPNMLSLISHLFGYEYTVRTSTDFCFFSPTQFYIYLHHSKLFALLHLTSFYIYQSSTTGHQQHPEGFNMQYWRFPLALNCLGELWRVSVHQEADMNHHHHHLRKDNVPRGDGGKGGRKRERG